MTTSKMTTTTEILKSLNLNDRVEMRQGDMHVIGTVSIMDNEKVSVLIDGTDRIYFFYYVDNSYMDIIINGQSL